MILILTFIGALGCGLIAGIFFAFSVCIMKALSRLPVAEGIAAMQAINVAIINPVFMFAFFGTPVVCIILVISAMLQWHNPGSMSLLAGGAIYLIGSFLVTLAFNVPKNNALASVTPMSSEGAKLWAHYLKNWTFWNHIRTITSLGASALLTIALCYETIK